MTLIIKIFLKNSDEKQRIECTHINVQDLTNNLSGLR